jgi:hypothetical protein
MAKEKTAYKVLVAKPKGKSSFGRPRRGWEVDKLMFRDWIDLAQMVSCCEHGDESSGSIKFGEFLDCLRFYSKQLVNWSVL